MVEKLMQIDSDVSFQASQDMQVSNLLCNLPWLPLRKYLLLFQFNTFLKKVLTVDAKERHPFRIREFGHVSLTIIHCNAYHSATFSSYLYAVLEA